MSQILNPEVGVLPNLSPLAVRISLLSHEYPLLTLMLLAGIHGDRKSVV